MRVLAAMALWVLVSGGILAQSPPKGGEKFFAAAGDRFDEKTLNLPKVEAPAQPPALFVRDEPLVKLWTGGAEFGVNGAQGNSDLLNVRVGVNARRKTADNLLDFDLLYQYGLERSQLIQNQMLMNIRDEVLIPNSPLTAFLSNNTEFDDLRAYRFRVGVYGGLAGSSGTTTRSTGVCGPEPGLSA